MIRLLLPAVCAAVLALAGCTSAHTTTSTVPSSPQSTAASAPSTVVPTTAPSSAASSAPAVPGEFTLVQHPQAGFDGIHAQTTGARHSIDMEIYELADSTEESDLAAAVARGVSVRVLLDEAFSGHEVNLPAYDYLVAHHVPVRWAPSGVIFHIKATTFDDATSDVSTANLTSTYYATTRDAEIIDTDPAQVRAIEATFAGDWNLGSSGRPSTDTTQAAGLVWSPDTGTGSDSGTAEDALVAQIGRARHVIDFESEELADARIYDALAADARRGVSCEITMTNSSDWDTGFAAVTAAGCRVHVYPDSADALYIHEKLILDDPGTGEASVLIGSQNASVTSLTRNRELGLLLTHAEAPAVLSGISAAFASDYAGAPAWGSSATPVATTSSTAGCTPLTNSGHCYTPGEQCRSDDHGAHGIDADGAAITCEDRNGWRWVSS